MITLVVVTQFVGWGFDFALLSGSAVLLDQQGYPGTFAPTLVYPVLAIILLVKRRDIEPRDDRTVSTT